MRPYSARRSTQKLFSWLFVVLGLLVGLLAPVACRDRWVGEDPASPALLTIWFQMVAAFFLAVTFVVASFTALRRPRRAGMIFMGATPLLAFAFAYPSAGYLFTKADGVVEFQLPSVVGAVALALLVYLPFVAASFAIRNRNKAQLVFLLAVVPAAVACASTQWAMALIPRLAAWSVLFLAFGAFWLGTSRLAWPPLLAESTTSIGVKCLLVAFLVLGGVFAMSAARSSLWTPDCSGGQLFTRPLSPAHVVITARVVRSAHTTKIAGSWAGSWAVAVVEERFWGLPSWARVVLLTNGMFWEGRSFFVSGRRAFGPLARHLPIVDAMACGSQGAKLIADARPELRLLHAVPREGGSRIVGYVLIANPSLWKPRPAGTPRQPRAFFSWRNHESRQIYEWALNSPRTHRPLAGARISVTGPLGTTVLTAARDGTYELPILPGSEYTLHLLDAPAFQFSKDLVLKKDVTSAPTHCRMDLVANWMGTIEGTVTDAAAGNPIAALVELRNPDGTNADRAIGDYRPVKNGSFRFENLPAGSRYLVLMNRFGPGGSSPYPSLYFPSARRPEDARVFEVRGSEAIRNVDFHASRLQERELRVRATWPDRHPVDGGSVTVTNVQSEDYDDLRGIADEFVTDRDGMAKIRVFGDARVRVQAITYNPEEAEPPFSSYSRPLILDTLRLPANLNLVVPFAPAHRPR